MPTENSLKNLRVSDEVRKANLEKMRITRKRQTEREFQMILDRIKQLPVGMTQVEIGKILEISSHKVGRAIRWEKERKIQGR